MRYNLVRKFFNKLKELKNKQFILLRLPILTLIVIGITIFAMNLFVPTLYIVDSIIKQSNKTYYKVTKINTDTITVIDSENQTLEVKLIAIKTKNDSNQEIQECYEKQLRNELEELLLNQWVYLVKDSSLPDRDENGNLLRYVYYPLNQDINYWDKFNLNKIFSISDEIFVNEYLIYNGFAILENANENIKYDHQKKFKEAQEKASKDKLRLWNSEYCKLLE